MKLDKFVEESIKQVIAGVDAAKKYGDTHNALVNPASATFSSKNETVVYCLNTGVPIQQIVFDVAVTITKGSSTTDDTEATVGEVSVAGNTNATESKNSSVSRIKFTIPVLLPLAGHRE